MSMLGLIYAHNQSSMHLRPSNRVMSLFCPNNRRKIVQIVLIWSFSILLVIDYWKQILKPR